MAYFNEEIDVWEPFIEPCYEGFERKPWKLVFHTFQGKSFPISPYVNFQTEINKNKERKISNPTTDDVLDSDTSGEESDQEMIFLRRRNFDNYPTTTTKRQNCKVKKNFFSIKKA